MADWCDEDEIRRRIRRMPYRDRLQRFERHPVINDQYDVVVAIDFGTTFSGFAFSFNHRDGNDDIYMNRSWGSAQGCSTLKTPTCILLNPEKKFFKFGFEAAEQYASLEEAKDRSFYCFDRFKMMLHGSEKTLNRDTLLEARNGKRLRALDIFSKALEYLKDRALDLIHQQSGVEYTAKEVRWVLTVPAIWKQSAKQFMREAAYQAGLAEPSNSSQLIIALEPEAAAVYCRQSKLREFVEEKGDQTVKDSLVPANTQYLVIDNGGGTMDVTAHEIDEDDNIKEIYHATGGDYGGTKVDQQFENLMDDVFGKDFMVDFRRSHPSDWLELTNEFEGKKRAGDRVMNEEVTRIRLPANFINLLRHENGKDDNRIIRARYSDDELKISKDFLCLGSKIVKTLFQPAITSIVNHLKSLQKKNVLRGVKLLFLVGGFSESSLLQARVREEFKGKYRILILRDAETAVVKGAVMFGKRPNIVIERCLAETYGTKCYQDFVKGYHDNEKLEYVDHKPKCKDVFSVLAREDEKIKIGQCKTSSSFHPVTSNQKEVHFEFFTSINPDVRYTTDAGVRQLPASILLKSPDTSKGTERELKLKLFFNTEIKVVGIDVETGNEASIYIDFLSH